MHADAENSKYFNLNDCNKNTDNIGDTCSHCLHIWTISSVAVHHKHHHSSCCEGRSLFVIHLHSIIWERGSGRNGELCRINVSVFIPLCLGGFDTAINCLLFKMTNSKGRKWKSFRMHKQRVWLEGAVPRVVLTAGVCVVDVYCFH